MAAGLVRPVHAQTCTQRHSCADLCTRTHVCRTAHRHMQMCAHSQPRTCWPPPSANCISPFLLLVFPPLSALSAGRNSHLPTLHPTCLTLFLLRGLGCHLLWCWGGCLPSGSGGCRQVSEGEKASLCRGPGGRAHPRFARNKGSNFS